MIPDIAVMLAAYMVARLIRSVFQPKPGTEDDAAFALLVLKMIDVVAVVVIAICAIDAVQAGARVATDLRVTPRFTLPQ